MQAELSIGMEERKARPVVAVNFDDQEPGQPYHHYETTVGAGGAAQAEAPNSGNLDDNHYHHKQQAALDDMRDHLKPLYQLHHRKAEANHQQPEAAAAAATTTTTTATATANKLNIIISNNNIGKFVKTAPMGRTIATRQASRRRATALHHSELAFIAFVSLSVALVGLVASGQQAHGLDCYHCSSVDDPGCDEAFASRANYTETDCRKHLGPDKVAKVCRKIVQHIEDKMVVIRSCGYIDEHDEKDKKPMCYKRSGTFAIMMESCNCYENNCNSTLSLVPNISVLSLAALFCSCGSSIMRGKSNWPNDSC